MVFIFFIGNYFKIVFLSKFKVGLNDISVQGGWLITMTDQYGV